MKPWHLSKQNLPYLINQLTELLNQNQKLLITVSDDDPQRTDSQNKRLWGFLYKSVGDHLGYTSDEIHLLCGYKFLRDIKTINNETVEYIKSTTKLSTADMQNYQNQIETWAISLGWGGYELPQS